MSPELFRELCDLRTNIPGADGIFVPYIGKHYAESEAPRLMFIGKATEGWEITEPMTLESQIEHSKAFCEGEDAAAPYCNSAFWHFLIDVTLRMHGAQDVRPVVDSGWAVQRAIWSNLMKIGVGGTKPRGKDAKIQREISARILQDELDRFEPSVIMLTVGGYFEWNLICAVFGKEDCWSTLPNTESKTWYRKLPDRNTWVFWTRHPQGWALVERNRTLDGICRVVGR
tara:strand:- start:40 stop:723 length:684 start_codon:yes stop_codon:yes gene_type:complete